MTRLAILGYGNIGKGIELAVKQNNDMDLVGIFTRRDPASVKALSPDVPVLGISELDDLSDAIDVLILCGGSATDLPVMTPQYAARFNVVDSFDHHAHIPQHFANVDAAAASSEHVAVISAGWDPGMFSLARLYGNCLLPEGADYTFWGEGVSQGHSDAIRRVAGVVDARAYTLPVRSALAAVRAGENPVLTARQKHTRECFVAAEDGADLARIERDIKEMPDYFDAYDTTVHFITAEELKRDHAAIPHGGFVLRSGTTGGGARHLIEYSLTLESNPEFTASVLVACARAAHRMYREGSYGCKTMFDMPPAYLSSSSGAELRARML